MHGYVQYNILRYVKFLSFICQVKRKSQHPPLNTCVLCAQRPNCSVRIGNDIVHNRYSICFAHMRNSCQIIFRCKKELRNMSFFYIPPSDISFITAWFRIHRQEFSSYYSFWTIELFHGVDCILTYIHTDGRHSEPPHVRPGGRELPKIMPPCLARLIIFRAESERSVHTLTFHS